MHQSLGTAVFSGMIGVTLFGIFLTPVFFFVLLWFGDRQKRGTKPRLDSPRGSNGERDAQSDGQDARPLSMAQSIGAD